MFGKFLDKILHEDEKLVEELKEVGSQKGKTPAPKDVIFSFLIFFAALAVRLIFLFFVADPQNAGDGWYGDTYHHWQIAYLTRDIGLKEGFLRLWDFKGMEYFWGPAHPLLLTALFALTGSISIVIPRIVSLIFGSLVLVLIYLIASKYWNRKVGVAAAFLGIVNPVAIFNDASGMLEPTGFALLLAGILLLESAPIAAGLVWALATMVRAEAWIFSVFLIFVALTTNLLKKPGNKAKLALGFIIPVILYMKYLLDYTGNPIYPLWWNYLANARGFWAEGLDNTITSFQLSVRPYLLGWAVVSLGFLLVVLWKKPKGNLMFAFGFAIWSFLGGFFGASHYLKGFEPWFWYIRFFVFPYLFVGLLLAIFLFYLIPKLHIRLTHKLVHFGLSLPVLIVGILIQPVWLPILAEYHKTDWVWARTKRWGEETGRLYQGGKILIPEGYPSYTYTLSYFGKVPGKNILGQMFDPFYYFKDKPFDNWEEQRKEVLAWLKNEDVRLLLIDPKSITVGEDIIDNSRYTELVKRESDIFNKVGGLTKDSGSSEDILEVYRVFPEKINLNAD